MLFIYHGGGTLQLRTSATTEYRIGQRKDVFVHVLCAKHLEFGDNSFDLVVDNLLDKKRQIARGVFAPLGELSAEEVSRSFKNADKMIIDWDEIDRINPHQFEHLIAEQIKADGYSAKLTQKTHDNGADIVVRALNKGEIKGLIQVKHKLHNKDKIGITPVRELLQARDAYKSPKAKLTVVSNTSEATQSLLKLADEHNVTLILRTKIHNYI